LSSADTTGVDFEASIGYKLRVLPGSRLTRFLLAAAALSLCASCSLLYTGSARYSRDPRRAAPPPKSKAKTQPGVRSAPKTRALTDPRKGKLPWPVSGTVASFFGTQVDPKYKTVTRNSGIDILAAAGADVVAVDSGKVSFADQFMGYGKMVILDHGNRSHSIYSKLADMKVRVGDVVRKGGVVGAAADTLHFEFRVAGKSVDPLEWLLPK
jgi:septal ring factor EnvC (AmiA/AmiB activator)